jgi:catechol 2,3-dioxygenase-like lactoylglutathione lyase family enzyme
VWFLFRCFLAPFSIDGLTQNARRARLWTIIGVADVPLNLTWYQSLLGLPRSAPAHDYFGQIVDPDGTVLLCLHEWGAHDHPSLASPHSAAPGNGLLLFFRVDNFEEALLSARALVGQLAEEPHVNPNTRSMEFSLRDPNGYYVTVSALEAFPNGRRTSQT